MPIINKNWAYPMPEAGVSIGLFAERNATYAGCSGSGRVLNAWFGTESLGDVSEPPVIPHQCNQITF
jgi:hypothetical protein